jgi:hypothetical protein
MTSTDTIKTFETGKRYFGRFITDADSVFSFEIARRTAKFVWLKDRSGALLRRGVRVSCGAEYCLPYGSYSMAPSLSAERVTR